jgi:hypothetical protein
VVHQAIGRTAREFVVCGAKSFFFPLKVHIPPGVEFLQRQFADKYGYQQV